MRRGNLKHLRQPSESNTCGQTCVAMLARVSYEKVISVMGRGRTNTRKVREGLRKFGLKSDKLTQFRGNREYKHYKKLNFDALLKLKDSEAHKDGNWHWIVWDAKRKKKLDPQDPAYKVPPARIISFIRVRR